MPLQKLASTDAFVVTDLTAPDGSVVPAAGLVRTGKKILQSSATDLARSATYTLATFEMQIGGASAGINAVGDDVGPATSAFVAELTPMAADGSLYLDAGKGTERNALGPLIDAADVHTLAGSAAATVISVVAAADVAVGGLDGRTVAIEGVGVDGLGTAFESAGATVVEVPGVAEKPWTVWGADVDVIACGSKPGAMTHQGAEMVQAKAIVPWGPIPFTTKAFAILSRNGVAVVPDFISAAGGLVVAFLDGPEDRVRSEVDQLTRAALGEAASQDDGLFLGSCYRAEAFLSSWSAKPFGRPLAA